MPWDLQPVGLEFFETAPYRHTANEVVHRSAEAIFAAVSEDPAGWGAWYPGFSHQGRYLTPPPHGVGAVREVVMVGVRYREQVLAWDTPQRWAFCVERTTFPFAHAFAEDYRVTANGGETTVAWTLAMDPRRALRVAD